MNGRSPIIRTRRVIAETAIAFTLLGVLGAGVTAGAARAESFGASTQRQTVTHKPLARSVVDVDFVSCMGSNTVVLAGTVHHQDRTGWVPSKASPVWVMQWNHWTLAWQTVRVTRTDAQGRWYAEIKSDLGVQAFRVVRPVGAKVAAATSDVWSVDVTADTTEAP